MIANAVPFITPYPGEQNTQGMGYPGIGNQGGSNLPTDGKNNPVISPYIPTVEYGTIGQPGFVVIKQYNPAS